MGMQMKLRKMMIEMVLGTDMKQHWTIMSRFQTKLQVKIHTSITTSAATNDDSPFNSNSEADRFLILQVQPPTTMSFQHHCHAHAHVPVTLQHTTFFYFKTRFASASVVLPNLIAQ